MSPNAHPRPPAAGAAVRLAAVLLYNLLMIAGFVYLIGWRSWSPWWMLLALTLMCSINTKKSST